MSDRTLTEEEFYAAVREERQRQIERGYTPAHDDEHGPNHLARWAIVYAARGKVVKAAALMLALDELLERQAENG